MHKHTHTTSMYVYQGAVTCMSTVLTHMEQDNDQAYYWALIVDFRMRCCPLFSIYGGQIKTTSCGCQYSWYSSDHPLVYLHNLLG